MPEFLTINRRALRDALLDWQLEYCSGRAMSQSQADDKPAEEVADEGARVLWHLLERGRNGGSQR